MTTAIDAADGLRLHRNKSRRFKGRLTTISLIELADDIFIVQEHSHISGLVLMEKTHTNYDKAHRHWLSEKLDIQSADAIANGEAQASEG